MKLSPSIMCADLMRLEPTLRTLEACGVDSLHVDIMDGHFVPGFTFGADFVRQLASATRLPVDVHLMSDCPLAHIGPLLECGIDALSVHVEPQYDLYRALELIRSAGVRAGVALNPATPEIAIEGLLDWIDLVLVMSVSPGCVGAGQIPQALGKAARLSVRLKNDPSRDIELVLDGGVKPHNARQAAEIGVDRVVSGSGVFRPDRSLRDTCDDFRRELMPVTDLKSIPEVYLSESSI